MPTEAPYGSWVSLLEAADLVQGAVGLGFPCRSRGSYIWQEARPSEEGRVALVARTGARGPDVELLPSGMSARTTVHEYGGRAWAVNDAGLLVTSNLSDQRLWALAPGAAPAPLTEALSAPDEVRFACPVLSPDGEWAVCVRERHLSQGVFNDLVAVPLAGARAGVRVLAEGHDFYSSPSFTPDGGELAFICWDHPEMPWDTTQLWRGEFFGGSLHNARAVVPAEARESVVQPRWGPRGELCYVSDRSGWWNLYADGKPLAPMAAEFAGPAWVFGESSYVFLADGTLVATWRSVQGGQLGLVQGGKARSLDLPYSRFYDLAAAGPRAEDGVLAVAGSPLRPAELVRISLDGDVEVLRRSRLQALAEDLVSVGKPFSFPTGQGETAHGLFYPPHNPAFRGPPGQSPPLIVTSHGGPTDSASEALNLRTQYWTTRGFAVADVDYRGSSGYGRSYRQSLNGRWGEADVEDCARAAQWLAAQGWADAGRAVIRGGSASGLTALAALARYEIFAAAFVLYAVSDITSLATMTHKFESRYLDRLVPAGTMAERSPTNMVDRIKAPVFFLQGLDDRVVPPEQSRAMVGALHRAGVPAFLVEIEGEGHGFRKATTLVRAQEVELAFYGRALGFVPAGDLSQAEADLAGAATETGARWS